MNLRKIIFLSIVFLGLCIINAKESDVHFAENHKFKILQLTDIHFGANLIADFRNTEIMSSLLKHSNPNFVAITGDAVCSNCKWAPNVEEYVSKACWTWFHEPFKSHKVHYGYTIGNHDCEGAGPEYRTSIIKNDQRLEYSHTQLNPPEVSPGSTYFVPVFSSFNTSQPSLILWFFDTKEKGCMNLTVGDGCVGVDQIEWFKKEDAILREKYGDTYISFAFVHIPPPEFVAMFNNKPVYGNQHENICCPKANSGFVDALIERKVQSLFAGHDHDNDFGGFYNGIELVYGRKTGYGYYGPSHFERGGRFIEVTEQFDQQGKLTVSYEHYVIEGSGKKIPNGPLIKRNNTLPAC